MYELERYDEAYDMDYQIILAANDSDDRKGIDKKQLLLEAKINTHVGNPNTTVCKKLIKICPECLSAYIILRVEARKNGKALDTNEDSENDENERLVLAFNDGTLSDEDFLKLLSTTPKSSKAFSRLSRRSCTIA